MLAHKFDTPQIPTRVVVLGAGGFVGGAAAERLVFDGVPVVRLGRNEVDLCDTGAAQKLAEQLNPSDALLVVSANAPCKNTTMLAENIQMMESVCCALEAASVAHLVYISSDAVYADDSDPLHEASKVQPDSLHGMMHAARELMLRSVLNETPFAVLRPSLLYGLADPHNGYGPNQFRRRAEAGEDIVLFGDGEERRDHVLIDDVAEVICLTLRHRSHGALNVATGDVTSFRDVAEMVAGNFDAPPTISARPRQGPMPHNGYRPFDITACRAAFPGFRYTPLGEGMAKTHAAAQETMHGVG